MLRLRMVGTLRFSTVSAIVTLCGIFGALLLFWAVRRTPLRFLFERPELFWIAPKKPLKLQPAH